MARIRSVYIAGPQLHPARAEPLADEARLLCEAAGFEPVTAEPGPLTESDPSEAMAREIYASRLSRMRLADAAILDLSPFRGPNCDPAAAFDAGFFAGVGKPVFAYLNVPTEYEAELSGRVEAYAGAEFDESGVMRDVNGSPVEDYGLPESLMLWAEARRLYVIVTPTPESDLTGLQLCLDAVKLYAD